MMASQESKTSHMSEQDWKIKSGQEQAKRRLLRKKGNAVRIIGDLHNRRLDKSRFSGHAQFETRMLALPILRKRALSRWI